MKTFKQFLNESNLNDLNINELYEQWVYKLETSHLNIDSYIDEFKKENPELYNKLTDDEIDDLPEFDDFVYASFEEYLNEFDYNISKILKLNNNYIPIFRAMTVDDEFFKKLDENPPPNIGIYWSWVENSAEAHWADIDKPYTIIIESIVHESDVNWFDTYLMNSSPGYIDEREIRLPENTQISILRIHNKTKNKDYDIKNIKGIIFKS